MIKVVVVDDSAFMRKALSSMLEKDPGIKVVATARDGEEGLLRIREYDPDVVTLDIEMPRMDGLTALRHIMKEMPRPVLMVSSLTVEGAKATLKAMELGAVDFIPKQLSQVSVDVIRIERELQEKVRTFAYRKMTGFRVRTPLVRAFSRVTAPQPAGSLSSAPPQRSGRPLYDAVGIGVSTGGPPAVQKLLTSLPADFPVSIMIAQHMPAAFTGPFAKRLDGVCAISVKEAEDREVLRAGTAYVAPGGTHLRLHNRRGRLELEVGAEPVDALYKPSANELMESMAVALGRRSLGVILTGMGSDGMAGVTVLKERGGRAFAQSDSSCVIYGMPKAIVDAGLADEIVDIDDMGKAIMDALYK